MTWRKTVSRGEAPRVLSSKKRGREKENTITRTCYRRSRPNAKFRCEYDDEKDSNTNTKMRKNPFA